MTTNAWDNYIVNTGTADNARNGDALRRAFEKVNQKFYNTDNSILYVIGDDTQSVRVELDVDGGPTGDITINSSGNTWTFGDDGTFNLPASTDGSAIIQTTVPIKINSNGSAWTFSTDGVLSLPTGGDIQIDGQTVLGSGGGGVSISDFGDGFGLDNADKIVTRKLYSTNETNSAQHYRLELDTNGVVVLPDQSIINGATLRVVPGTGELNYAALAAGPDTDHPEQTWMWVDSNGAWVATDSYDDYHTWNFDNSGRLNVPNNGLGLSWTNSDTPPQPIGGWFASGSIGWDKNRGTYISNGVGGIGSVDWVFGKDGALTLPGGATVADSTYAEAVGSSYTFSQDSYGATTVTNAPYINIYQGVANITDVQDGWVIHTSNSIDITIDHIVHSGTNYELHFSSDNSTIIDTIEFPITISSPDYSLGSTGTISLSTGPKTWTLSSDGSLNLPSGGIIKDSTGKDIRDISQLKYDTNKRITMTGDGSGAIFWTNYNTGGAAGQIYANTTDGFGLADLSGYGVSITGYNGNKWTFRDDGKLQVPGGIYAKTSSQVGFKLEGLRLYDGAAVNEYIWLNASSDSNITALNDYNGGDLTGFTVEVWHDGSVYSTATITEMNPQGFWSFGTDASLGFLALEDTLTFTSPDYVPDTTYDLTLNTGFLGDNKTWTFGANGKLAIPSGGSIIPADSGSDLVLGTAFSNNIDINHDFTIKINADLSQWIFSPDSTLTFPDSTIQTTAYPGISTVTKTGAVIANVGLSKVLTVTTDPTDDSTNWQNAGSYGSTDITIGDTTVTCNVYITEGSFLELTVTNSTYGTITVGSTGVLDGTFTNSFGSVTFSNVTVAAATVSTIVPTAINVTKTVNELTDGAYTLADGVEGQMLYLTTQPTVTSASTIVVTIANARNNGSATTNYALYPFINRGLCSLLFTNGSWQYSTLPATITGNITGNAGTAAALVNGSTSFRLRTSAPAHSYGASGDLAGDVFFNGSYIYYCKQNYVNNSTNVWVRSAWTSTSW